MFLIIKIQLYTENNYVKVFLIRSKIFCVASFKKSWKQKWNFLEFIPGLQWAGVSRASGEPSLF